MPQWHDTFNSVIAGGSVKEGEDGSHLTQVRNQLAIRDSGDGDVRDVVQVATENLVVVAKCFLDAHPVNIAQVTHPVNITQVRSR